MIIIDFNPVCSTDPVLVTKAGPAVADTFSIRVAEHSTKARRVSAKPYQKDGEEEETSTTLRSSTSIFQKIKGDDRDLTLRRDQSSSKLTDHHQWQWQTHDGRLPRKYTDEGQGALKRISPPVEWYNVPEGTKSLALVVQDIDAPDPSAPIVPWTCWVVVNIPPSLRGLPEGFSGREEEEAAATGRKEYGQVKEGLNDWKLPGWRSPKLPSAGHRFQFKLYALDDVVQLGNRVTKEKLMDWMPGHVIAEAELVAVH